MTVEAERYKWPRDLVGGILTNFNSVYAASRSVLDLGYAFRIFSPIKQRKGFVPESAWRDQVDNFLDMLVRDGLGQLFKANWDAEQPRPLVGAVARYEPVLRKVPHYCTPSTRAWNDKVMDNGGKIEDHFLHLQGAAISQNLFEDVPPRDDPEEGAGLIPLLEHMAVYPKKAARWARAEKGALVRGSVLVVGDLKECVFVSEEGREWYKKGRGCLLLPFVAHDNRLVGHGLVVFDRALPLDDIALLDELSSRWKLIFDATFLPLIANLNSLALSALDSFFLGRIRELRHILGNLHRPGKTMRPPIPPRDLFVLNKISLYELLEYELATKEEFRVVFFDLDGFKGVNATIGHQMADVLLFHIVEELTHPERGLFSPRKGCWLSRFGGDEFVGVVRSSLTVKELSFAIAKSIERAHGKYNEGRPKREQYDPGKRLSTSVGWVRSSSVRELDEAGGMSKKRRSLLKKMREAHRLIEIADSDTQEHVKRLGKSGYLEFEKCRNLPADKEEASRKLLKWMSEVQWFEPRGEPRSPQLPFQYIPQLEDNE